MDFFFIFSTLKSECIPPGAGGECVCNLLIQNIPDPCSSYKSALHSIFVTPRISLCANGRARVCLKSPHFNCTQRDVNRKTYRSTLLVFRVIGGTDAFVYAWRVDGITRASVVFFHSRPCASVFLGAPIRALNVDIYSYILTHKVSKTVLCVCTTSRTRSGREAMNMIYEYWRNKDRQRLWNKIQ